MTEELRFSDPALRFWEPYLNESCKYLSQNGYFHCLYQMQLFIKVYVVDLSQRSIWDPVKHL